MSTSAPIAGVHTRRAGGYTLAGWGGTHSPGGEGVGGSIFWKTPDIGLASYSIISLRFYGICAGKGGGNASKKVESKAKVI